MNPSMQKSLGSVAGLAMAFSVQAETLRVFVGTYTGAKSEGIYAFRFDNQSGAVEPLGLAAKSSNPSFLALSPNQRFLYAVNEDMKFQGQAAGSITAFAIPSQGTALQELNQQSSMGTAPCHLTVDRSGHHVLAANYFGGSVISLPIQPDGSLRPHASFHQHTGSSVDPARQKEPHAHSINMSPDNRYALAADLGLDKILIYGFDPKTGVLKDHPHAASLPPGSGPRHFAFAPDGRHAFVINEMLSTLTSFAYDPAHGSLKIIQTLSTLPPGAAPNKNTSTAQVCVHPNGKFVYGSNRGDDSIAVFSVSPEGKLTWVERVSTQGKTPRNFNLDPSGRFLWAANQSSDSIVLFRVDPNTGRLTPTGKTLSVGSPVCVVFAQGS